MSLIDKYKKIGNLNAGKMSESKIYKKSEMITTDLPILNVAFSGDINGGFTPGITIFAGDSKTFKSMLLLISISSFLKKYEDGICVLYDSEFGITPDYLESCGIDPERVLHVPITNIEELKFDVVQKLNEVQEKEKIMFAIDSLGMLASKKEVEDAENEKSVADMSRAKAIRSLLRIITPLVSLKNIPFFIINHVYKEQGLFPKTVIPGGLAVTFSSDQIFVISKAQIKDSKEVTGFKYTITIEKSRFVKEKSKFTFIVDYNDFIKTHSGLLELALEAGVIKKPSSGWYQKLGDDKKYREKETYSEEFWKDILEDNTFNDFINKKYALNRS